jgi:hypothetical protein
MKTFALTSLPILRLTTLSLSLAAIIASSGCASPQNQPATTASQTPAATTASQAPTATAESQAPTAQPVAMLTASPNPVPAGEGMGTTKISWKTANGAAGQVYVAIDGEPEKLFAEGVEGSQDAPWINAGTTYEFHLYEGSTRAKQIAAVKVTRSDKK